MALFSSSLVAGLGVVTFFVIGADVVIVTVVGTVTDDVVIKDNGSILSSSAAVSSKVNAVDISAVLVSVTVPVSCQPEMVNSSSPLGFPLPSWDSSNSAEGLVT